MSQKDFSRENSMLLAWLEEISHYQLSEPCTLVINVELTCQFWGDSV
eukprot:UN02395